MWPMFDFAELQPLLPHRTGPRLHNFRLAGPVCPANARSLVKLNYIKYRPAISSPHGRRRRCRQERKSNHGTFPCLARRPFAATEAHCYFVVQNTSRSCIPAYVASDTSSFCCNFEQVRERSLVPTDREIAVDRPRQNPYNPLCPSHPGDLPKASMSNHRQCRFVRRGTR